MLSINTNLSSYIAQRSLKTSTNKLNQAIERMTTGFKINHASDNAANYSITTNMSGKLSSYEVAEENTNMGLDLLVTASDTLSLIEDRVQRLRDLQEQALNGTYGEDSLKAINQECNSLVDEINRLYLGCEYNGINLFLEETIGADGTAEILQTDYADKNTRFEQLGITSSSFSIYDKNNTELVTYDIEGTDCIDDFLSALKTEGFNADITGGKISVTSKTGLYIAGDLADQLGIITTETTTDIISTSQTSNAPVDYQLGTTITIGLDACSTVPIVYTSTIAPSTSLASTTVATTATSAQTLSEIGISSTQYITVRNGEIQTVLTCKTSDTIGDLITKLTNAGIRAEMDRGLFHVRYTGEGVYISEMSSELESALGLNCYCYTTNLSEKTEITVTVGTTRTAVVVSIDTLMSITVESTGTVIGMMTTSALTTSGSTSLGNIGLSGSMNITINSNGTVTTVSANESTSINQLLAKLNTGNLKASFSDSKLAITMTGDSYITSDRLASLFNLPGVTKTVNSDSNKLTYERNLLDEVGDIYAPGSLDLQIGVNSDSNSQITVKTSFSLTGYSAFRNIGLDGNNYLDQIDEMMKVLNDRQVEFGAAENRLESVLDEISTHYENLTSSRSTLRDADIAEVSSEYIREQILQQASATLMATANQSPSIALQLI